MIYVLTLIGFGYYEQVEMTDPATCRVYQSVMIAEFGEDLSAARCEWVRYVAA